MERGPSRNLKVAGSSPAVFNVLCPWARHFTSIVSLYPGAKWGATWDMGPLVAPTLCSQAALWDILIGSGNNCKAL